MIAKYLSTNAKPISDLLRVHTPESDLSASFQKIFHAKFARYIDYELSKGAVTAFPVAYLIELYVAIAMVFLSYSLKKGLDVAVVQSLNDFQKQIFTEKSENSLFLHVFVKKNIAISSMENPPILCYTHKGCIYYTDEKNMEVIQDL